MRSKKFLKMKVLKIDDNSKDFSVSKRGSECRGMSESKRLDKSKLKLIICHKVIHFMKDCLKREDNEYSMQIVVSSNKDSYNSDGTLVVSNLKTEENWVMDLDFSYHTCSRK